MDGRWLVALAIGALAGAPRVLGSQDRKRKSRSERAGFRTEERTGRAGVSRQVARKVLGQIPSARELVRAVERREQSFEQMMGQIPVVR